MLGMARSLVASRSERAENAYATHVPVLVALSRLLRVERVLELGCGEYSTSTFLDRSVFPCVKELRSIEDDPAWAARVMRVAGSDERFRVTCVQEAGRDVLDEIVFRDYDLIFIDDSQNVEGRTKTIRRVADRCDRRNVVVIHDFEVAEYRRAARALGKRFTFSGLNPYTGMTWTDARVDRRALRRVDGVIREHAFSIQPDDAGGWLYVLGRAFER
jgi:predicted O-methyltransferase YrrM